MKEELITIELKEPTPGQLIQSAIDKGIDVDKLDKLMSLYERWNDGKSAKSFIQAVSNFQNEVGEIKKTKTVTFITKTGGKKTYKYAPLPTIVNHIQPFLFKNGLIYRWEFEELGDKVKCTCIVSNVDGHSERTSMTAGKDATGSKTDIQAVGSSRTYMQRYTLIGALGITTAEEDNDAATVEAAAVEAAAEAKTKYPEDNRPWLSEKQFDAALNRINKGENDLYSKIDKEFKMKKQYRGELLGANESTPIDLPDLVKETIAKLDTMKAVDEHFALHTELYQNNTYLNLITAKKKELAKPV